MVFWDGLWWIFPLVGLAIMVGMVLVCGRMMGGMLGFGCMGGHGSPRAGETEDLRQEVQALKAEIQRLRDR